MASVACVPSVPAPGDAGGLRERARGAMLGLAVGDALGAPAENMKPSEIRRRWGRITGYVTDTPAGTRPCAMKSASSGTSARQCGHQWARITIAIGPWSGSHVFDYFTRLLGALVLTFLYAAMAAA